MPQVTVYIRKEDMPKWEVIDKKAEFISNALNDSPDKFMADEATRSYKAPVESVAEALVKKKENLCEHFQTKGNCRYNGCKFA